MPISDELISEIQEQDASELADALKDADGNHYQAIFQQGFSTAHKEAKEKQSQLEAKITTLESDVEAKEQEIAEAKESGDTDERVEKLQREKTQLEESNQQLKAEKQAAEEARSTTARSFFRDSLREKIVSGLIERGTEPDYAREVLAPQIERRIDVAETDGEDGPSYNARFMDSDGVTPLQAENGKLAATAAESVYDGVADKWKRSAADSGGGAQSGGAAGGSKSDADIQSEQRQRHDFSM